MGTVFFAFDGTAGETGGHCARIVAIGFVVIERMFFYPPKSARLNAVIPC